jgi:hypothetical protein
MLLIKFLNEKLDRDRHWHFAKIFKLFVYFLVNRVKATKSLFADAAINAMIYMHRLDVPIFDGLLTNFTYGAQLFSQQSNNGSITVPMKSNDGIII